MRVAMHLRARQVYSLLKRQRFNLVQDVALSLTYPIASTYFLDPFKLLTYIQRDVNCALEPPRTFRQAERNWTTSSAVLEHTSLGT
jgi:hypothetical protein